MLVACQICSHTISDTAATCPKCHAAPDDFLGPSVPCVECGARFRAAYSSCGECGAPRGVELATSSGSTSSNSRVARDASEDKQIPPLNSAAADRNMHVAGVSKGADEQPLVQPESGVDDLYRRAPSPAQPRKGRLGGLIAALASVAAIGAAILAFVVPKLVGAGVGYVAAQSLRAPASQPGTSSAAELEAMWSKVESDPTLGGFYRSFKVYLPADFATFKADFVRHMGSSKDASSDMKFGFDWMQSFVTRNAASFSSGGTGTLDAYADAQFEIAKLLQSEDVEACAKFTLDGGFTPGLKGSQELKTRVADASSLVLAAIASGRSGGQVRAEPTDEQGSTLGEAILARGIDEQLLGTLPDESYKTLPLRDQCALGVAIAGAIADLPAHDSALWVAYNASVATNGK